MHRINIQHLGKPFILFIHCLTKEWQSSTSVAHLTCTLGKVSPQKHINGQEQQGVNIADLSPEWLLLQGV